MAEEQQAIELRDNFYRDGFNKLLFIVASLFLAIIFLVISSVYLYLNRPTPLTFHVNNDFRLQPVVSLDQPYLTTSEVLQWTADALRKSFIYDFKNYDEQLAKAEQYFTPDGWKIFSNQLNIYANYNNVQTYKLFITGTPISAPTIINEGLLSGRYAWQIQLPITLDYTGPKPLPSKTLPLIIWVVRVSTLDNLTGIAIDNVQVNMKGTEHLATGSE